MLSFLNLVCEILHVGWALIVIIIFLNRKSRFLVLVRITRNDRARVCVKICVIQTHALFCTLLPLHTYWRVWTKKKWAKSEQIGQAQWFTPIIVAI
jgi:hypothetical protein